MAKFEVLHDLFTLDGRAYARGEVVELDQDQGDRLAEEFGALRPVAAEKPARGRGKSAGSGESAPAES